MSNKKSTVSHNLGDGERFVIQRHKDTIFADVWIRSLTWRYNPPEDFTFPTGDLELVLDGHHLGDGHEALTGSLDGVRFRPDGKMIHIALSTRPGVPPVAAGDIDPMRITPITPLKLTVRLEKRVARQSKPDRRVPA